MILIGFYFLSSMWFFNFFLTLIAKAYFKNYITVSELKIKGTGMEKYTVHCDEGNF